MIVIGFACSQAFVYSSLYLIAFRVDEASVSPFAHAGLLSVLLWMIIAFIAVYVLGRRGGDALFSPPALVAYAILSVVGATCHLWLAALLPLFLVQGVCLGFPAAAMLCAWGRIMGTEPIERSIPEAFIASALGAAICFVFAAMPIDDASPAVFLMMIAGIICSRSASRRLEMPHASEDEMSEDATRLSGRILAGTCVYGLATGLVETFSSRTTAAAPSATFLLLLLILYCLAALQLFGRRPTSGGKAVLPVRGDGSLNADDGPLGGSYRLAVLLLMAGLLLVPVFIEVSFPEESVVLAGYLGISVVLIALFLVMGRLAGRNGALPFARGFASLFAGEVAGIVFGNVITSLPLDGAEAITVPIAGIAVLCGFLFLFTERDLQMLSIVVEDTDRFDETCERIAQEHGLSKREAEILPLALRGRTSERIAEKFFITKNTVDTHMRRIYAKCGVHSRQELIDLGEDVERDLGGRR